jgi:adenosylcobinamide-GDP ribazoletransferase
VGAIASLNDPWLVFAALIAAHAGARAVMPLFMALVPRARQDGLSADVGNPPTGSAAGAAALGLVVMVLTLGVWTGLLAAILTVALSWFAAWLSLRQIGGQTGDVLGATEQAGEIAILLVAAARL